MNVSLGLMAQRSCYSRYASPSPSLRTSSRGKTPVEVEGKPHDTETRVTRGETPEDSLNLNCQPQSHQVSTPITQHRRQLPSDPSGHKTEGAIGEEGQSGYCASDVPKFPWMDQPSWTVLGRVTNAQWVRRKQEIRGTQPW
ncbi:alpha-tubulin N-acetyltransferase 1-like [Ascaphus truei]|uniref:alpha-tubulin N-acetyltransferase 1-like n=1 Tax=Ascaphus truei TaxID=8439 RepID=UPI003F5A5FAE